MTYDAFDVVVVPFPFTDRAASKRRPALVISNSEFNSEQDQVILGMITSAANAGWTSDVAVSDLSAAGLRAASVVRMKLFTMDQGLVLRKAGNLSETDRQAVADRFRSVLF